MRVVLFQLTAAVLLQARGVYAIEEPKLRNVAMAAAHITQGSAIDEERDPNKKTSADKRQEQRDRRRSRTNPDRSQGEEDNERRRKQRQNRNSGRGLPCVDDPYCDDDFVEYVAADAEDVAENEAEDEERNPNKKTSADKRQEQRDHRRSRTNPDRSQGEEDNERRRKQRQNRNSGRGLPCVDDPYCDDDFVEEVFDQNTKTTFEIQGARRSKPNKIKIM